jgi:hypothetical protein
MRKGFRSICSIGMHVSDEDEIEDKGAGRRSGRIELTKQKLIAHVKPKFCALLLTSVYAKKNAMVTRAPMIIVPRRPQKYLDLHM